MMVMYVKHGNLAQPYSFGNYLFVDDSFWPLFTMIALLFLACFEWPWYVGQWFISDHPGSQKSELQ